MREHKIIIEPFSIITLLECTLHKQVGEHTTGYVSGVIEEGRGLEYVTKAGLTENVRIYAEDENGKRQTLFNGIAGNIQVAVKNGVHLLSFSLVSRSKLMDITPKTRTFQDKSLTSDQVCQAIQKDGCEGNIMVQQAHNKAIGSMLIQYRETDWEFLSRLAANMQTVLVADDTLDEPFVSVGLPGKGAAVSLTATEYSIHKDIARFLDRKQHAKGARERDAVSYGVESREIYPVAACVSFLGQTMYVAEISTRLEGSTLLHAYTLQEKEAFQRHAYPNMHLIGASLTATVKEVRDSRVRVKVDGDVKQGKYRWFEYATVFSSPDNTGWYFMPEVGDQVRLCCPDEQERHAYVSSSMHVEVGESPDTKYIRTKYGKEIVFSPTGISISNGAGSTIALEDEIGVNITTDHSIKMKAKRAVTIQALDQLKMTGKEEVVFAQADNTIEIRENIDLTANYVRIR